MNQNRRKFIRNSLLGAGLSLGIPGILSFTGEDSVAKRKKIKIAENDVILFQGDSITDMGRNRSVKKANDNDGLGPGYPFVAASQLLLNHPNKKLKIYNRGISGNVVPQLIARWKEDCIDLKPNILSIQIGVNDFWHTLDGSYKGTVNTYRDSYDELLDKTTNRLPDTRLIIGEPYAIKGVHAVDDSWFPAFDEYRSVARELAEKYNAAFIPYQEIYDKASKQSGNSAYWTEDGVHPNTAGDGLMAKAILDVMH